MEFKKLDSSLKKKALNQILKYHESSFISDDENILNYVLVENNEIIGEVDYQICSPDADLLFIYIDSKFRGMGYSKILLKRSFEELKNKNIFNVFLEVRKSNKIAISLYTKANFEEIGERKKYYSDFEDAVLMKCNIGE